MHIVVLLRWAFFVLSLSSRTAVVVVAAISLQEGMPLAPATLFVALPNALTLLGLLLFDFHRSRTGTNFFCFVCKIWFELIIMAFFVAIDLLIFIVLFLNQEHSCNKILAAPLKSCQSLKLICIFQAFTAVTVLSYVTFLGVVTWTRYNKTPTVLSSTVRDFQWDTGTKTVSIFLPQGYPLSNTLTRPNLNSISCVASHFDRV